MQPVTAQHAWRPCDFLPIDDGHVVVQPGEFGDHVVDLTPLRAILGDRQQKRRTWRRSIEQFAEFLEVDIFVTAVVAAQVDHHGIEVFVFVFVVDVEAGLGDFVAELHETAGFSVDLDGPADRVQSLAEFLAVPGGRRREDRVADHQEPIAVDALGDRFDHDTVVIDRAGHHDRDCWLVGILIVYVECRNRDRVGQFAHSGHGRNRGRRRRVVGVDRIYRSTRTEHESERDGAAAVHRAHSISSRSTSHVTSTITPCTRSRTRRRAPTEADALHWNQWFGIRCWCGAGREFRSAVRLRTGLRSLPSASATWLQP